MSVDPAAVLEEAIRQAMEILDQVLSSIESPAVPQAALRRAFDRVRYEPGGIEGFVAEYGEEESVNQAALAMARVRGERRKEALQ